MSSVTEEELRAWLRDELGIDEYRRVVRGDDTAVVISKFEPGFSQELFATVDRLPELFDDDVVAAEYALLARSHLAAGKAPPRTQVWREAAEAVLNRSAEARGVDAHARMYVLPGIESVQAVLDTVLWSCPTIAQDYTPRAAERAAYAELEAPDAGAVNAGGRDIFTRFYGTLDGRTVANYCPGAQFGRRLLSQGWGICTGSPGA